MRVLALEYYYVLGSVLRRNPELRRCCVRCHHCRIFFLTDPRNAGRKDLRCPFGCRKAHRKRQSARSSAAHYNTPSGKDKKRKLNQRRSLGLTNHTVDSASEYDSANADISGVDDEVVEYVRVVTGLVEGRAVSREEIIFMLMRILRQHSMARENRVDYVIRHLNSKPPG